MNEHTEFLLTFTSIREYLRVCIYRYVLFEIRGIIVGERAGLTTNGVCTYQYGSGRWRHDRYLRAADEYVTSNSVNRHQPLVSAEGRIDGML
jgi:hypothetical protein